MARSTHWLSWLMVSCCTLSGCSLLPLSASAPEATEHDTADSATAEAANTASSKSATVAETAAAPAESTSSAANQPNYFNEGVTRAQSAVAIGQSAQSTDDWNLAASRWQQAVLYMQQVPDSHPNYSTAQQKVQEYGQNLAMAQKRAAGEVVTATPTPDANRYPGLVASIPVIDQMGGTPVVPVSLTGSKGVQQFNMLFDTGASGTLITQAMADHIGVLVTGSALVTVADGRQVEIPVGYVDTLQVGDLVVRDIWVGIGGDVGLLGQDVYGEYGLSIGSSQIDLYE